jgi:hypothetical protein
LDGTKTKILEDLTLASTVMPLLGLHLQDALGSLRDDRNAGLNTIVGEDQKEL